MIGTVPAPTAGVLHEFLRRNDVPAVTVVIPTRDRTELVERALRSALAQTDVATEIIVVDDGSHPPLDPDRWSLHHNVRVIRNARSLGVSAARNVGINAAASPYVAFLDDDDVWAPTKLRSQIDALHEQPDARWSAIGSLTLDADLVPVGVRMPPADANAVLAYNPIPGGGSGVLAATSFVRQLGGFNEWLGPFADWDLWIRMAMHAPLASVEEIHMGYVLNPVGMSVETRAHESELKWIEAAYRMDRVRCDRELDLGTMYGYIVNNHRRAGRLWHATRTQFTLAYRVRRPMLILVTLPRTLLQPGRFLPKRLRRHPANAVDISQPGWLRTIS